MKSVRDPAQSIQRIKVGLIGLAAVVLLIAIASSIIGSGSHDRSVATAGIHEADMPQNTPAAANAASADEPLVELGVAPSTSNTATTQ